MPGSYAGQGWGGGMRGHGEDAAAGGRAEHPARGPGRQPARTNEWRGPSEAGEASAGGARRAGPRAGVVGAAPQRAAESGRRAGRAMAEGEGEVTRYITRQRPRSGRRGPPRPRDQGPRGPGRRAAPAPPQAARARAAARRREAGPTPPPPPPLARGSLTFRVAPDHHARARPPPPASLAPPPPHGALAWGGEEGRGRSRTAAPRSTLAPRSQRPP